MPIQPPPAPRPRPSYWPLVQYLQALPSDAPAVVLELQTISDLLGGTLPLGAGLTNFWAASVVAAATWNRAGFTATLDHERQQVTFRRR